MRKTVIVLLAAIIISLSLLAYFYIKPQAVDSVYPARGPAVLAVYATGTVEASVSIPVAPRMSARLIELFVDEGQTVERGEILALLEDDELQEAYAEARAQAVLAQKEFERQAMLVDTGATAREAFDRAAAAFETAQARVAQAQAALDQTILSAPDGGLVMRRDGEIGELIAAGQNIFWLARGNGLRVVAEVDEEDIALIEPGQPVAIRADAFPGRVFDGAVQSVTPMGDPVARSYRVRIGLPQGTGLMIGMTAETNIIIREEENALLAPASAVRNSTVWLVHGDETIAPQQVETGAATPAAVEILAGLDDDDLIVRDASEEFTTGQAVRPQLRAWSP